MVTEALCLSSSPSSTPAVPSGPLSASVLCLETLVSPSGCGEVVMHPEQMVGPGWDAWRPQDGGAGTTRPVP